MSEKYYTAEHIQQEYSNFTKNKRIEILYDALDIMQSYNGRTKFLCIAMAMGYNNYEGEDNTYTKNSH